jgi:hypothetical protein
MKRIFITLFVATQAFAILAQKSTIDKVANAACDCINTSEINNQMTSMDAELMLGKCIAPSILENKDALMKEMKLKEFNEESGYQIGIEVAKKLAAVCPKFIELSLIIARNNSTEEELTEEFDIDATEAEYDAGYLDTDVIVVEGKYVREEGGAQRFIIINSKGNEEKLLWLKWFDSADDILADPSFFLNHEVQAAYVIEDLFDGISRTYIPTKVVISILANE